MTVVAIGSMVPVALQAADVLAAEAIEAEVIDLRSLAPWDAETVVASVRKTGRLVTAHEAWVAGGIGAEVVAVVAERAARDLRGRRQLPGWAPRPYPSRAGHCANTRYRTPTMCGGRS